MGSIDGQQARDHPARPRQSSMDWNGLDTRGETAYTPTPKNELLSFFEKIVHQGKIFSRALFNGEHLHCVFGKLLGMSQEKTNKLTEDKVLY